MKDKNKPNQGVFREICFGPGVISNLSSGRKTTDDGPSASEPQVRFTPVA